MHKIELVFDNADGTYGLVHKNAIGIFDPFWTPIGIFHDVFEHWFEGTHKNFLGEYAFNHFGEVVAMGAMHYYYMNMGVHTRLLGGGLQSFEDSLITTCTQTMQFADENRYAEDFQGYFGKEILTSIGPVKAKYFQHNLDVIAEEMEKQAPSMKGARKSIFSRGLHFGTRLAEKLVPHNSRNVGTIYDFLQYWTDFCKNNSADDLAQYFKGVTFRIRKVKGEISWTATLDSLYYHDKSPKLNSNRNFDLTEYLESDSVLNW